MLFADELKYMKTVVQSRMNSYDFFLCFLNLTFFFHLWVFLNTVSSEHVSMMNDHVTSHGYHVTMPWNERLSWCDSR